MTRQDLFQQIIDKQSYLCVGLDTDISLIPKHLFDFEDPVFEFNRQIIDATQANCIAYKPNLAFYEAMGPKGWVSLQKTLEYIPKTHFTIADAKRGDIGNTSRLYAKAFFETLSFDAITVAPYMGEDSVKPFLGFKDKWVILLGLTSNPGSNDFQKLSFNYRHLYEEVILKAQQWATPEQLMFVIGATHPDMFEHIRSIAPEHFFLVPGIGAQGGDLEKLSRQGMNRFGGLLVNSSREIIYAGKGEDFADKARIASYEMQQLMAEMMWAYL